MKTICLSKGFSALVDDTDFDWLSERKWSYSNGIAVTHFGKPDGIHQRIVRMHRIIMEAPEGVEVDHIDGNPLNNQRSNLRLASKFTQAHNQKIVSRNTSGFRGVHWHKGAKKWRAFIMSFGTRLHLGYFNDPQKASEAWNTAALKMRGELPHHD